ncbi:hypothetical protein [Rhodoferax sp.]|uniref:hypothetical protein n=1 Tax=Rhodoferax sp. TaxID=50421 RepID=UPI002602B793|nr:hypothetical protein [Rhodoferax sp.]MDD2926420.1 hypothetical protein [Rhodoferax sp.]
MSDDQEPKLWVTALKLVIGAIVLIALVGLALYYTAEFNTYSPDVPQSDQSWGITKDSPIRSNR